MRVVPLDLSIDVDCEGAKNMIRWTMTCYNGFESEIITP
jgi:hypothetical protein